LCEDGADVSQLVSDVLDDALEAGIVIVAAAGNSGLNYLEFPACHSDVIAISAFGDATRTPENTISFFQNRDRIEEALSNGSQYFAYVCTNEGNKSFWCPGVATVSTFPVDSPLPSNGYKEMDGTSFACAIGTGIIGSLIQREKTCLDTFSGVDKVKHVTRILEARSRKLGHPRFRVLF
jgi:subtilisin family serine protease